MSGPVALGIFLFLFFAGLALVILAIGYTGNKERKDDDT